jgi:hypothetical protein
MRFKCGFYVVVAGTILGCVGSISAAAAADDARELPSYVLMSDEFLIRGADAAEAAFHSDDPKVMAAKLKEYGVAFPKEFRFPQQSRFILVVSDRVGESFASVSAVEKEWLLIIDLQADRDSKPPKVAPEGKKNSRLILVGCPKQPAGVKGIAIKSADGVRHAIKTTELNKAP